MSADEVEFEAKLTPGESEFLQTLSPEELEIDRQVLGALDLAESVWTEAVLALLPNRKDSSISPGDKSACNPRWLAITRLAAYLALNDSHPREQIIRAIKRAYIMCKKRGIPVHKGVHSIGNIALGSMIHVAITIMKKEAKKKA